MRPDGVEVVARWREVGAWWEGEAPREVVRYRDERGVRRETIRPLPQAGTVAESPAPYAEDNREEYTLRPRKVRDEKVARACGYAPANAFALSGTGAAAGYAPLHVLSGYAFGRSVLFAQEIPRHAARLGLPAVGIADPFSLVGAVEFVREAKACGVKPLVGASFEMVEGGEIVLIARDKTGYQSLSQLITDCHLGEPRLHPLCNWERLERYTRGLMCLTGGDAGPVNRMLLSGQAEDAARFVDHLVGLYGRDNVFAEVERAYLPWEMAANGRLLALAERLGILPIVGGAITHAEPEQFPAQDVLTCSETLCTVDEIIGRKPARHPDQPQAAPRPARAINAERYLRDGAEMAALFAGQPDLLVNSLRVAERVDDDVLPARTRLPELFPDSAAALRRITYAGAALRHKRLSLALRRRLDGELERIQKMGFSGHFLTMWDACRWAGDQGILFSGRGSVVDCAVAYCLGLSRIDAFEHRLHFDRFLPGDGSKRPDIDIDFEAHRRDDVRNYLTRKYGVERVATVAAVGAFNTRGIVREVGKALGLAPEVVGFLAKRIHGSVSPERLEGALQNRPELRDSPIAVERFRWVFRLAKMLADVPRNMRAHSSGVVISDRPLSETVPVMWSAAEQDTEPESSGTQYLRIIQWDKRSAKHYFDKFDILCLRGQDVLAGTQERIRVQDADFSVEKIALDDEETYRAMRSGELIGIPQSASPAMRQAHVRLHTANLHDASLVQAGIRPGVGGAVKLNELIARRRGLKPYSFECPEMEQILGLTYGIIVFQEQVDQLLQTFCGYTSGEAEEIREEIHKRRREDYGEVIKEDVLARARANGYSEAIVHRVFDLVSGFRGYGFAQGHALAFAEVSVRSIYCQQNFPAEYFAALLDAQPAGYYGPCTLVNEARARGVSILPVDVNRSEERFIVEDVRSKMDPKLVLPGAGIRVSFRQVEGLSKRTRERLIAERQAGAYRSFFDFVRRVEPARNELENLILCGALDGLSTMNRRSMLWGIPSAMAYAEATNHQVDALALDVPEPKLDESIDDFTFAERAIRERVVLGLDVEAHLMAFERERVRAHGGITGREVKTLKNGQRAMVVGTPIRLRFPPTSSGKRVVFFDLEDETGLLNVTCFDDAYQRDGHAIVCSPYVTAVGVAQWRDDHVAFLAKRVFPYRPVLRKLVDECEPLPVGATDFLVG